MVGIPPGYYVDESTDPPSLRKIVNASGVLLTGAQSTKRAIGKSRRVPNKTEAEYGIILRGQWPACLVKYEPITLHCDSCSYTPDFVVMDHDGQIIEINEVKGAHAREKDLLRLKAAAAQHPYRFFLNQKLKDGWTRVRVRGMSHQ